LLLFIIIHLSLPHEGSTVKKTAKITTKTKAQTKKTAKDTQ